MQEHEDDRIDEVIDDYTDCRCGYAALSAVGPLLVCFTALIVMAGVGSMIAGALNVAPAKADTPVVAGAVAAGPPVWLMVTYALPALVVVAALLAALLGAAYVLRDTWDPRRRASLAAGLRRAGETLQSTAARLDAPRELP